MSTCTFFGHRDCPNHIQPKLRETLIDLIVNHGVNTFYVGNQGQWDAMVHRVLRALKQEYPQIHYAVVLAYMPGTQRPGNDPSDTMLPEGIESVHPRYAISWRNNWMLKQADFVVSCVTHTWGGAAQYVHRARRQGKTVLNLPDIK